MKQALITETTKPESSNNATSQVQFPRRTFMPTFGGQYPFAEFLPGIWPDFHSRKRPFVLVIDDEIDALIPVEKTFEKLPCKVMGVNNSFEENIKRFLSRLDIIILDWMLGENDGAHFLKRCASWIEQFQTLKMAVRQSPPKLVTYSALKESELEIPPEALKYFDHVGHWQKPLPFKKLKINGKNILNLANFQKESLR